MRKLIDPSIQYKTRRPVSILKARKADQIEEFVGSKEPLEQSYMWDQDQAKEGKADENATIHSQNPAQQRNTLINKRQNKNPMDDTLDNDKDSQYSMDEDESRERKRAMTFNHPAGTLRGTVSNRGASNSEFNELSNYEYFRFD